MIRRSVAGAILGVSLLVGSLAWSGFVALRTVFDPDRSGQIADELLENDEVRSQIDENLAGAVANLIPPEVPVSDEVIQSASTQVLNDPAVERLLRRALVDTHKAFLGEGDAPEVIDLTPVAAEARSSLVAAAPQLDVVVPENPVLAVPLPTEHVPDASPLRSFLQTAVPILMGLSVLGAVLALVTTSDRPSILRRAGFWALGTTAVFLVIGLAIPWLLRQYAPDQAEVIAALLAALLRSTLVPSIVLGSVGVALLVAAAAWFAGSREPARRAPHPDAPHRRQAAAMDRARRRRAPAPRTRRPTPSAARSQPTAPAPSGGARSDPTRRIPTASPASPGAQPRAGPVPSPYPDGPAGTGAPARSPYPDGPGAAAPAPSPYPDRPGGGGAVPSSSRSVYGDPGPGPADGGVPGRWVEGHGWVVDPSHHGPLPAGARWVDGVGYVVPRTPPGGAEGSGGEPGAPR